MILVTGSRGFLFGLSMKCVLLCPRCTVGPGTPLAITAEILHKVHSYVHDVHL